MLAGKLFGIPVKGTHAHAFVNSFTDLNDIKQTVSNVEIFFIHLLYILMNFLPIPVRVHLYCCFQFLSCVMELGFEFFGKMSQCKC